VYQLCARSLIQRCTMESVSDIGRLLAAYHRCGDLHADVLRAIDVLRERCDRVMFSVFAQIQTLQETAREPAVPRRWWQVAQLLAPSTISLIYLKNVRRLTATSSALVCGCATFTQWAFLAVYDGRACVTSTACAITACATLREACHKITHKSAQRPCSSNHFCGSTAS